MFMVIAKGPNDIQMPVILANTREEAEKYLTDAGIDMGEESHGMNMLDGRTVYTALQVDDEEDDLSALAEKFFVSYDDGNGEVYAFYIEEVPALTPFMGWDLD